MSTGLWWKNMKKEDRLKNLDMDGRRLLKLILKKYGGRLWSEFIWLRIGMIGGLMRKR
jgi:hypothetical protein